MNNYIAYHVHSNYSLLDSCTNYKDYIDHAVSLGQKALAFTEHGNMYRWVAKKMYCDKVGIKYIHGVEVYMTLDLNPIKVRDNYHTVLLARNYEGVKEINTLVSSSYDDDHMYYKPRITFEEFANISDNVIKISACVGGPLCAIDKVVERIKTKDINETKNEERIQALNEYVAKIQPWKSKLLRLYDFLEVQYHDDKTQIEYNKYLWNKSNELGIPLIAGTDTHSLNQYKAECRQVLMDAKGIKFSDDDSNEQQEFDLNYKTYDELVSAFEKQGAIPKVKVLEAIENTNKLYDMVEDFELDTSFKYPQVSDNDLQTLKSRLNKGFNRLKQDGVITEDNRDKYIEQANEELRVFEKIDMCGFLVFMADLIEWCKENNIPVGAGRGSVAGSTVAYMLGITDVDPQVWGTIFSRFANEDRKEIGDIDVDFAPNDREKVYNHMIETFGTDYTAYILAITTVAERGCIDEIGRALHNREKIDNELLIKRGLEPKAEKYTLEYIKDIKQQYEIMLTEMLVTTDKLTITKDGEQVIEDDKAFTKRVRTLTVEKMSDIEPGIFKYFLGILGNPVAQSMHPAGMVVSPITLKDNYGIIYRNNMPILQIDMDDVHETGLVKYDILGLKNVQIIKNACESAGLPYPKASDIDWHDENVWQDMLRSHIGIFQFESHFAFDSLKRFKPKSLQDMSLVTAAIRPSGTSYRDSLFNKDINENPSEIIDELLKDNYGYLVYQEDTIKFLQQICGLNGSEADNIRRAIGRKQRDRLDKAMPSILEGYCSMSDKPREIAVKEAEQFLQIIEDSADYQFGYNHSLAYCMIGYLCAYYRYYYSPHFIVSFLNNAANEVDIKHGFELARLYGYNVEPPRFRHARATYSYDGDKTIYKGLSSVKWLNIAATDYLYTLRDSEFATFVDLLIEIKNSGQGQIDSRKMEILIKLNFFEEFGGNKKLMKIFVLFNKMYGSKQFSRNRELPIAEEWLLKYATRATDKTIFMESCSKVLVDLEQRPDKFSKKTITKKDWEAQFTKEVNYYNIDMTDTNEPIEPRIHTLLKDYELELPNDFYEIKEQIQYDEEFYGYINMRYDVHANYCYVQEIDTKFSPKVTLYSLGAGKTITYKINKKLFSLNPLKTGQAIVIIDYQEKPRWTRLPDGTFIEREDGSTELWLTEYSILTDEEWKKASGGQSTLGEAKEYERYLIYDLETGGFSGDNSDILEVGYMLCERTPEGFKEVSRHQFLVQTDSAITNSHIHGITNDMCKAEGITQQECLEHMKQYFNDDKTLIIGYNILGFDNKYFSRYANRFDNSYNMVNDSLDLCPIIKDRMNVSRGFKLADAITFYQLDGREQAHRAMSDVVDTFNVLNAYIAEGKDIDKWIKIGVGNV